LPFIFTLLLSHMVTWASNIGPPEDRNRRGLDEAEAVSIFIMLACAGTYVLFVAFRVAGCIVRERQRCTLETLLALPIDPEGFLYQKLIGNLARHANWLVPAGLAWLILMLFGDCRLGIALVALPVVLAVHLWFFAAFAMFLSVMFRSALSAYLTLGLALVVLVCGLPIFFSFFGFAQNLDAWQRGANPVYCWFTIATSWCRDISVQPRALAEISMCILCYGVLATMLWIYTCLRFERNPLGS
jgi:ABC-type transport system involved in multi-copper enzyme maturation permease subunit